MKVRYYGEKTILYPLLSKDLPNIGNSLMSIGHEKTKSIGTGREHPSTITGSFKKNGMVPATTKEELAKILLEHPEIKEVYIDGVERPVQRSGDYESQEKDYSGKKKRHTKKNIVIAGNNKMIIGISETVGGKEHDYSMLKKSGLMEALIGYILWIDLGFQGIKSDFPNHITNIPKKNYKKNPLTQDEKDENWIIASIRVIIENIIGRAKKYWIIANKYRNRIRGDFKTVKNDRKHKIMQAVCGLYNLGKSNLFIS